MYRKMIGIFIIAALLAGCSTETVGPEEPPVQKETIIGGEEEVKEVSSIQGSGEMDEVGDWVMVPVGKSPMIMATGSGRKTSSARSRL